MATNREYQNLYVLFNRHITKHLKDANVQTRNAKSHGVWCCILLPTVLVLYSYQYKVPDTYMTVGCTSVGLLCYSVLITVFMSVSSLVMRDRVYEGCVASSFVSTLLIYCIQDRSLLLSLTISFIAVLIYYHIIRTALIRFPNTFTVGEAIVVSQGIVLYVIMAMLKWIDEDGDPDFVNVIIYAVFCAVAGMILFLNNLDKEDRNIFTLTYIVLFGVFAVLTVLHIMLGTGFLIEFVVFVFLEKHRSKIIAFWLSLVLLAVLTISFSLRTQIKATTSARKAFHVLASLVFLTGILLDQEFTKLAAAIAFALLIFVEALRKLEIENVSPILQNAFELYCDEKDCGTFAMTPIYMFIGLACPLLLVPEAAADDLELLSGVLAIGVGDSAASWLGSKYGVNKWPGSNKTMEGTIFNVLAQLGTIYVLQAGEVLNCNNALLRGGAAALASSMVEAKTDQVDNLILPLISLAALRTVAFLR